MIRNRSVPDASVIPVLAYPDVADAAEWLVRAFGFRERLRIGSHRMQLRFGDGAVIVTARATGAPADASQAVGASHSVHVRVADVDAHCRQAREAGARILGEPKNHPYGERQYSAEDPGGHRWTFSQSIANVDPGEWGGTAVDLD